VKNTTVRLLTCWLGKEHKTRLRMRCTAHHLQQQNISLSLPASTTMLAGGHYVLLLVFPSSFFSNSFISVYAA